MPAQGLCNSLRRRCAPCWLVPGSARPHPQVDRGPCHAATSQILPSLPGGISGRFPGRQPDGDLGRPGMALRQRLPLAATLQGLEAAEKEEEDRHEDPNPL